MGIVLYIAEPILTAILFALSLGGNLRGATAPDTVQWYQFLPFSIGDSVLSAAAPSIGNDVSSMLLQPVALGTALAVTVVYLVVALGVAMLAAVVSAVANRRLPRASADPARLSVAERARLAEYFHLRGELGERVWPGFGDADIAKVLYGNWMRVLEAAGVGVTPTLGDAPCCGALHAHSGLTTQARAAAAYSRSSIPRAPCSDAWAHSGQ